MPLFFAHETSGGKSSQISHRVNGKEYLPTELSAFKINARPNLFSALSTLLFSFIGLLVSCLSYKPRTLVALASPGVPFNKPPKDQLFPVKTLGHAFGIRRNFSLAPDTINLLEERGYSVSTINKRTILLKKDATSEDWKWVSENVKEFDETVQLPVGYLSHEKFKGFMILISLTSVIARCFKCLAEYGREQASFVEEFVDRVKTTGTLTWDNQKDDTPMATEAEIHKTAQDKTTRCDKAATWSWDLMLSSVMVTPGSIGPMPSWGMLNTLIEFDETSVCHQTSDYVAHAPGIVCPFRYELVSPGFTFIGDVISKYFLTCLGEDLESQNAVLYTIRSTLGALRLTRVGAELGHFYKCLELAIEAQCGLVAIFTGSTYDGSILLGGYGASLIHQSSIWNFGSVDNVNDELKSMSVHVRTLREISEKFPDSSKSGVLAVTSMVALRILCLANSFTADVVEEIKALAVGLDFGYSYWTITPENLVKCFNIMRTSIITPEVPIGPDSLFSRDTILLGLSVFGRDSAPSWNIPGGALRKLTGKGAPMAPRQADAKKLATGGMDDGPWTMVVRGTKLDIAVQDFRNLARQGGFRSIPSAVAKKQHYKVFQGGRIDVFWTAMQSAYGAATGGKFDPGVEASPATVGRSPPGESQGQPALKKKKPMEDLF